MMTRSSDHLPPSRTRLRDRLGMICAVGAVACLSIVIVRWSQQYPLERSVWEQTLFSDLSEWDENDPNSAVVETSRIASVVETSNVTAASTSDESDFRQSPAIDEQRLSSERAPRTFDAVLANPIAARPPEQRPRFIQPVAHVEPSPKSAASAWLSGQIEFDQPDTETVEADETTTLHFPDHPLFEQRLPSVVPYR